MHRLYVAFLFSIVGLTAARAQTVRWEPPGGQLGFNQMSELALVFENCEPELDRLKLPPVEGLSFNRPSQSSETSMVNFSVTRRFSLVFPVRPTRRTAVTIPAFDVQTDKGAISVKAATYAVGDATVGNSGLAIDDVASAKLTAPKNTFWVGEVFPISYSLNVVRRYFHSPATNVEWQPAPLVAEDWGKSDPVETIVRGEHFVVLTQNTRAYAKQPGTLTIKPAAQMVNLMVGTSGFGLFAQPSVEQRQLESNPLELTIKPLPPAPADFSGAVGEFTFVSKVVPVTAAVGEPVTWTLELKGTGNWSDIPGLPPREASNDFQVVQPKSRRTMKDGSLFEGTLSEDVVLVPTRPGTYRLAPVRFTYFDPKAGAYRTLTSEPATVTITAGAQPANPAAGSGAPVQFSLNSSAAGTPAAPALPAATPPVPPENLPRDPLAEAATGFVPLSTRTLVLACLLSAAFCVLATWLVLAALRSRQNDPQRRRREARKQLTAVLAELNSSPLPAPGSALLRQWQQQAAVLWEIPHAAPGTPLVHACVGVHSRDAASTWAKLWSEADRAQHSREPALPSDWATRAEKALQAVTIPGWAPFSLFAPRNLLPFLGRTEGLNAEGLNRALRASAWVVLLFSFSVLPLSALGAEPAIDAYKRGDFPAAEQSWRTAVTAAPSAWTARHNLGLALAQQDRWAEATAYWTSAFLLNSRADATRWDLALGLQRSGMAPPELVELSRGEHRYRLVRLATPGEWQLALAFGSVLLAAALIVLLLQGYRHIGAWAKPTALLASLLAVLLATAATFSLHTYGSLAHPAAALVWKPTVLRSIPTEADTTQKTSPLSAGSIAIAEKTFLGWTKLNFSTGQTGWVRSEDLIKLYR